MTKNSKVSGPVMYTTFSQLHIIDPIAFKLFKESESLHLISDVYSNCEVIIFATGGYLIHGNECSYVYNPFDKTWGNSEYCDDEWLDQATGVVGYKDEFYEF